MLRVAQVVAILGLLAAAGLLVASHAMRVEAPQPLWVATGLAVVAMVCATMAHPKHEDGSWRQASPAPRWTKVLIGLCVVLVAYSFWENPEKRTPFGSREALIGRPDRVRRVAVGAAVICAVALHVARRGLRIEQQIREQMNDV